MPITLESKKEQAIEILEAEISAARERLQPISRRRLIGIISKKLDLVYHDAEVIVEEYCEEKEPGTPEYLDREWFLPYVKMMALIISVLGLVAIGWGADRWHNQVLSWPFFIVGAVAFGFGGVGLMKALRGEREAAEEENTNSSSQAESKAVVFK